VIMTLSAFLVNGSSYQYRSLDWNKRSVSVAFLKYRLGTKPQRSAGSISQVSGRDIGVE